jgi:predicted TIM-barrel fold metal-dependent hydrolase
LIEGAFERFGAARIYWGSNFPVVGGQSEYQNDLALVLDHKLPVPAEAVSAIAGLNAKRLWFPELAQRLQQLLDNPDG